MSDLMILTKVFRMPFSVVYWFLVQMSVAVFGCMDQGTMFDPQHGSFNDSGFTINYSYCSEQGNCPEQQNRIAVHQNSSRLAFGIFASHGDGGHVVADQLVDKETGLFPALLSSPDPLSKRCIEERFVDYNNRRFEKIDLVGSTAVTCFFDAVLQKLFVAHCGDSTALLLDPKKREFIYESKAHSLGNRSEYQRIKKSGCNTNDRGPQIEIKVANSDLSGYLSIPVTRAFGDRAFNGVISKPCIFETGLAQHEWPMIGILYSSGFYKFFADSCDSYVVNTKGIPRSTLNSYSADDFQKQLKIIIYKLIDHGRPSSVLSSDLMKLMNQCRSLNDIIDSLDNDIPKLDMYKGFTVKHSNANVSVLVFTIEKNVKIQDCVEKKQSHIEAFYAVDSKTSDPVFPSQSGEAVAFVPLLPKNEDKSNSRLQPSEQTDNGLNIVTDEKSS